MRRNDMTSRQNNRPGPCEVLDAAELRSSKEPGLALFYDFSSFLNFWHDASNGALELQYTTSFHEIHETYVL